MSGTETAHTEAGDRSRRARLRLAPEYLPLLYEFTESWQRAATLDEVYEAALDAITSALHCPRASILLFDETRAMQFVAWRELSENYRKAVNGHSPWTPETRDAKPICLENIETAGLDSHLTRTILREGIRALAFVPLLAQGRLLGKFMIYYDTSHQFTASEIDLALTISRQLAFSVERTRAAQNSARLAAIVECSDDAIISKDLNGVIKSWNRSAERLFGYSAQEAIGQPVTILIPPERLEEEPHILSRIRAGERIDHFETVRLRKDGTQIDISLTVSPITDAFGTIIGASKISRDISERKRARQMIEDSEQHLQTLLEAMPAAVYTTDAQGNVTYYNQAAVDFAGREPEIGSDQWCVTWKLYNPDGTPLAHEDCPMAIALKQGRAIRNAEAIAERPDGTRVPFIPYPTPLRDSAGNVVGAINMLVDIGERKQAESHQRTLLNELNHRVKNNMQMIQSLLDSASRRLSSIDPGRVIEEASRRVAAMAAAQQILYGTQNATRFKADDFADAICRTAQETLPETVSIICDEASGDITNDAAMPLSLILNELITNAAKHGPDEEGRVTIRVGVKTEAGACMLMVEDDGPGFDLAAAQPKASGLRLVQGLASQLRGRLDVTANPTRCSVRFPQ